MKTRLLFVCCLPFRLLWAADGVGIVEPLTLPQPGLKDLSPGLGLPESQISAGTEPPLSRQPQVFLTGIKLIGNTVFSDAELAGITGQYLNRHLSAQDLRQLRHELTLFYVENGYINSGAVLPEQKLGKGELQVQIIEGRLTELKLEGLQHLRTDYLQSRIERHTRDQVLNIKTLQADLELVQQNPLIRRINAELSPGLRRGEALLRAHLEEANPWHLTLGSNNFGVPSVGAERFETWAGHRNVFGFGDGLEAHFNISAGQIQYDFDYAVPVNSWDGSFKLHYQKSEANVVEQPFDTLNIFNAMEVFGLGFDQPVWQTLENQVTLGLLLEHRHSQSFLLDEPFSFSRGSIDGASDVSVVRFKQEWLHRTATQVLAFRSVASWGVDALDATIHPEDTRLPDSNFFVWLGQAQWIQLLGDSGVQLQLRCDSQISASPLLSLEQFTLGGRYSVRGYRQNQLVRDSGVSAGVELRIPVLPNGLLKLAPFYDVGSAWNQNWPTPEPQLLHSTGVGLLIDPTPYLHAELYWAHQLKNVLNSGQDLQDDGIQFAVTYQPF